MKKYLLFKLVLCYFCAPSIYAQRELTLGTDQQYTVGSGSSFDTRVDKINDTHFITIWTEGISSSNDVYARIGQVDPANKTVSYGAAFLIEDANSSYPDVLVLSETKAVVFLEKDLSNDQGEAKIINFDLATDNITSEGAYTAFSEGDIRPSSFGGIDAKKISETQFVVSYLDQDSSEKGIMKVGTVTNNTVSFGEENVFATADVQYQSFDLVNPTTIIIAWEDNGTSNDPGVARVGTISGTAISWGPIYTFHASSSNANRFNAVTSLDNNKFVVAFMNDADGDSGAAVVGTRTGNTLSFGSLQTFNDSQACRDITIDCIGGDEFVLGYNGGTGNNSAMYVGKLNGDAITFGSQKEALNNLADESRVLALDNNTIVFAYVNESTLFDLGEVIIGTLPPNTCIEPDVPTLSVVSEIVSSGENISLTVTGSLGDASAWHVYSSSCGVNEITSSGTSPILLSPGDGITTYYVRGEGACAATSSCASITVYAEGALTSTYTDGAWDNGTPNAAYHAIINDNLTALSDFNAFSLTINEGNAFDLNGSNLSITNDVTLESAAVLLDDGLLTSIGGTQTVKRNVNAEALSDFHLMSSPVANGNYEDSFQGSYVYRYVGDEYDNIYSFENGADIVNGEGTAISGNGAATTRQYIGNLNKDNIDYTLISTDEWHLLGNPYPAPLSLSAFQAANSGTVGTTFYFYNEATGAYNTWSSSLNTGTGDATANAGVAQAFFAEEINSSATQVSYTSSMRTNAVNTFLRTAEETASIKLQLNNTETLIAWNDASSHEEDTNDASYLRGSATSDIYSLLNGKAHSIQAINNSFNEITIPLGFYTSKEGINTIGISHLVSNENIEIILIDNYENTAHNLNTASYEFMSDASEEIIEDRFEIIIAKTSLATVENESPENKLIISGGNSLDISSENTLQHIAIYDITGKLIYQENNINSNRFHWNEELNNAICIIELTTESNTSHHKVILKP